LRPVTAAVLSIWTGARVIAGGMTREFRPHDRDEKGRPLAHNGFGQPPSFSRKARASHIPSAVQVHSINQMEGFCSTSLVDPANEVALIRAARMYQEGLWIAESEPALSWLLFVSAAEVIAGRWDQKRAAPIDSLKASKPNLVKKVEMLCPDLVPFLADELAEISGATRKFVNFLLRFKPDAPAVRPPVYSQVNWEPKKLKSAFQQVYGYRSKALHAGIPFPAPMCSLPLRFPDEAPGFTEKPFGLAQSRAGGVWLEKDLPMLLHTFEYILRNSVIAWWKELTRSD